MVLSDELISQFVKVTNDETKESQETTHYGTIVQEQNSGNLFVQLDGSNVLTPVETTTTYEVGERVTVRLSNHTATITGNLSSPAARTDTVQEQGNKITEVENLIADTVTTEQLQAESARIDSLVTETAVIRELLTADNAEIGSIISDNVEIRNQLNANKASIDNLSANKLDATVATATYATIANLDVTNQKVYNLEGVYAEFEQATTENLEAVNAAIDNLDATYAKISELEVERGRIDDLESTMITAEHAAIKDLQADVADIDTLIFGSASGTTIQSSFANAVIAQLGNAQIKSAMIDSVSASKVTAGDIITNNVRVKSEDGKLLISDETLQISDSNRVRVQIGKDAANDYSINIWDQNGNLMFSKGGITDSAIKDAIIRNDMVSDTANIAAHKLDIDSLFEEINGSTKTIKSTRVFLDEQNQSLDVAFKTMETDISGLENTVTSQGTQLSAVQGQIASKVWQQDIDSATNTMSTRFSALEQELDGFQTTVSETNTVVGTIATRMSTIEQTADEITTKVGSLEEDTQLAQNTAESAKSTADNAETLIQQLRDSISMLVTDGNGTSLMTQTENGWTFSTAEIQANAAKVAEDLHTLTSEVSDNTNAVDVLKQAVADLGEIAEYVKIGTFEGQPCIELGEGDSEFKLRITNTQIMFMEGSNIVAHINNQSLHIKKAVIEEELQQGGFVWKVRSNGNMGLVWKGVSG